MSNAVTAACRPLQMPPTAKAVLMCMADCAADDGECWPSIPTLAVWTCFSERAVQNAIYWLEASKVVIADRSNGRHTRYMVSPAEFTHAPDASVPTQQMRRSVKPTHAPNDKTHAPDASHPRTTCVPPTHEVPSNHKEPSRTINKATTKKVVHIELPEWLPADAWADWCDHRKAIKSPMTPRAAELSIEKLADFREQGFTPAKVINNAIERGWRGLFAPGQPAASAGKPSAAADFRGKTYAGTAIDKLPPDLRDAAIAALGDD